MINLEPEEDNIGDIPVDDEDVGVETKDVEIEGSNTITKFPVYVPLRRGKTKVLKDIDESKVTLHTPLFPD